MSVMNIQPRPWQRSWQRWQWLLPVLGVLLSLSLLTGTGVAVTRLSDGPPAPNAVTAPIATSVPLTTRDTATAPAVSSGQASGSTAANASSGSSVTQLATRSTYTGPVCPFPTPMTDINGNPVHPVVDSQSGLGRIISLYKAVKGSFSYVPSEAYAAAKAYITDILTSIMPMLIASLAVILVSTLVGALVGALGSAGIGAIAGAAAGAQVGLEILDIIGLGFLAPVVLGALAGAGDQWFAGTKQAWLCDGSDRAIDEAAHKLAKGTGILLATIALALLTKCAEEGSQSFLGNMTKWEATVGEDVAMEPELECLEKVDDPEFCFAAGTPVHIWRNDHDITVPIESVREGYLVLSKNPISGQCGYKPVVVTFQNTAPTIVTLTLTNGEQVTTTPGHPFATSEHGDFKPASSLSKNDTLVLCTTKSYTSVSHASFHTGLFKTYNFDVADWHTYFVSRSGIWVHNQCGFARPDITLPNGVAGNKGYGWLHIEARHITGVEAGGDLFPPGTTRTQVQALAQYLVAKGNRTSDPSRVVQVFERHMSFRGLRAHYRVVLQGATKEVISCFPVLQE